MRKFIYSFVLAGLFVSTGIESLYASSSSSSESLSDEMGCRHTTRKTSNNFPIFRARLVPTFEAQDSALGLMGEWGPRSYRLNGTYGMLLGCNHRFKVGVEWLSQKLRYNFRTGKTQRWLGQVALGGKYQYTLDCPQYCWTGLEFDLSYSHSMGHGLDDVICTDELRRLDRRIADSVFWTAGVGAIFEPWECGNFTLGVTYDNIRYHRHHQSSKRLSGAGLAFDWKQRLYWNFLLDVKFELKRPYNYVNALLSWNTDCCYGDLGIGVFANHVWGKAKLPNSTTYGAEVRLAFGVSANDFWCLQSCDSYESSISYCDCSDIAAWVSDEAVYRPEVLCIADQGVVTLPIILPPIPQ